MRSLVLLFINVYQEMSCLYYPIQFNSIHTVLDVYKAAHAEGKLRTRIRAALPLASWRRLLASHPHTGSATTSASSSSGGRLQDHWLQVGCLKAMIDGSLGTHTAAFFDDYSDVPGDKGHLIWDTQILESFVQDASAAGLQVAVHAIGDRANSLQLDIFERVSKTLPGKDLRFRIEHAQHIAPQDVARFGRLGVVASMQMSHLADDGRWAERAIGATR